MTITLRATLTAIVALLGLLVVGFSALNGYAALEQYRAISRFSEANRVSEILLSFAADLAIERGLSNAPLHAPDPLPAARREEITRVRARADGVLPGALAQLREMPAMSRFMSSVDELAGAYRAFADFRRQVDDGLVKPRSGRPAAVVDNFAPTMTDLIDRTVKIRMILEALVTSPDAPLVQLVQVRHVVAQMAEEAGRERAIFGGNIAQKVPFSQNDIRNASEHRGRITMAWGLLQAFRLRPDLSATIAAAIAQVEDAYMQKLSATRSAVLAAAATGQYPISGLDWVDQSGLAIATIVNLMEVVGNATHAAADLSASASLGKAMLDLGLLALGAAVALASFVLMTRRVIRPLTAMTTAMWRLAKGDRSTEIPAQGRQDEVGRMAAAVAVFKQNMIEADRLRAEQEETKSHADSERRAAMSSMADAFESGVKRIVQLVSTASSELQSTARSMSGSAEQAQHRSTTVAAAAGQASGNVQIAVTAAEQLAASISEIGRDVNEARAIAKQAVDDANRTNAKVQALSDAAEKIGDVVKLINNIAGQTNLLALNATIEAARAGEAGRGFAIVASEVKSLAGQTAKATDEIAGQIKAIQTATGDSVQAIGDIGLTIGRMSEIATTVAAAVEEQDAATREIARNVQQASSGTRDVSSNIADVSKAAAATQAAATQVLSASTALAEHSDRLHTSVDAFIAKVRAG